MAINNDYNDVANSYHIIYFIITVNEHRELTEVF